LSVSSMHLPSDVIDGVYSGTTVHVSNPQRLTIERVRAAYDALDCEITYLDFLIVGKSSNELIAASPIWAVAAHETRWPAGELKRVLGHHQDLLGFNWLGMKLDLEPDYLRGYADGYFGVLPTEQIRSYRHGWRDGSECHRYLINTRPSIKS